VKPIAARVDEDGSHSSSIGSYTRYGPRIESLPRSSATSGASEHSHALVRSRRADPCFPSRPAPAWPCTRYSKSLPTCTIKRAGLPAFRVYDLRHTYPSLLLARSAPITYVAAQLGHANPSMTLRFYARWSPGRGQRWVEVLDACLQPDLEPELGTKRAAAGGRDAPQVIDSEWSRGRNLNPRPADYELSPRTPTDTNDDASTEDFRTQD
jgi:hypothetical protein